MNTLATAEVLREDREAAAKLCGWPKMGYAISKVWLETGRWPYAPNSEMIEDGVARFFANLRVAKAAKEKRTRELEGALAACGTYEGGDTCNVCKLHFEECEAERIAGDDEEYPPFDPAKSKPACAGAVARQVLATKNV